MQLTPYSELITLTADERERKNVIAKAARQKQRGLLRLAELDEKLASTEDSLTSLCQSIELDFDRIADKQDELALLIRRKEQLKTIIDQLFPTV